MIVVAFKIHQKV